MASEICGICKIDSTPWFYVNSHICEDCYHSTLNGPHMKINYKFFAIMLIGICNLILIGLLEFQVYQIIKQNLIDVPVSEFIGD